MNEVSLLCTYMRLCEESRKPSDRFDDINRQCCRCKPRISVLSVQSFPLFNRFHLPNSCTQTAQKKLQDSERTPPPSRSRTEYVCLFLYDPPPFFLLSLTSPSHRKSALPENKSEHIEGTRPAGSYVMESRGCFCRFSATMANAGLGVVHPEEARLASPWLALESALSVSSCSTRTCKPVAHLDLLMVRIYMKVKWVQKWY